MSASRPIFRVSFSGPDLGGRRFQQVLDDNGGRRYEGSEIDEVEGSAIHRALVGADSEDAAVERVGEALAGYAEFSEFATQPVLNAKGDVLRTPIRTRLNEIDWDMAKSEVALTALQQEALIALLDAGEPTWKVGAETGVDREAIQASLRDLESRALVRCTREQSDEADTESELEDWWRITDAGWDVLGLIKSPRYS
jgi:hypothetical protein